MRSFFPQLGGKSRLAKRIVKLIPPHKVYTEPFVGAGSVLLAKPISEKEVISDTDKTIYHIWSDMKRIGDQMKM